MYRFEERAFTGPQRELFSSPFHVLFLFLHIPEHDCEISSGANLSLQVQQVSAETAEEFEAVSAASPVSSSTFDFGLGPRRFFGVGSSSKIFYEIFQFEFGKTNLRLSLHWDQ